MCGENNKLEEVISSPNIRRSADDDIVSSGFEAIHVKVPRSLTSTALKVRLDVTVPSGPGALSLIVILGSSILPLPASLLYSHIIVAGGIAFTTQVNLATDVEVVLDRATVLFTTKLTSIGSTTNVGRAEITQKYHIIILILI